MSGSVAAVRGQMARVDQTVLIGHGVKSSRNFERRWREGVHGCVIIESQAGSRIASNVLHSLTVIP